MSQHWTPMADEELIMVCACGCNRPYQEVWAEGSQINSIGHSPLKSKMVPASEVKK